MSAALEALTECAGPIIVLAAIYLLDKAQQARSRRHHPAGGPR